VTFANAGAYERLCQAVWRTHSVLTVDYVQVMEVDRTANADALLKHLEAVLGPLDESRSVSESLLMAEDGAEFGVVAFGSRRATTFATFGISRHLLSKGSDDVSQELLVAVEDREFAVNLLSTVGRHVLDNHHALDTGEALLIAMAIPQSATALRLRGGGRNPQPQLFGLKS
jgi:hypothetical protein